MMALLTCIVLFIDREEYHSKLEDPKRIEGLCERYTLMLQRYLDIYDSTSKKFPRLVTYDLRTYA